MILLCLQPKIKDASAYKRCQWDVFNEIYLFIHLLLNGFWFLCFEVTLIDIGNRVNLFYTFLIIDKMI